MQKIEVKNCNCDEVHDEFLLSTYTFEKFGSIALPDLCLNSDLNQAELFDRFEGLVKTLETNKNWTLYSLYVGQIARVQDDLYFCSFGDIDEIGESNFYISGTLYEVTSFLLSEWGNFGPSWREFFIRWSQLGLPEGIEQGSFYEWKLLFNEVEVEDKNHLDGLQAGVFLNMQDKELKAVFSEL